MEGSSLELLVDDHLLVSVSAEGVFRVSVLGWGLVSSSIKPLRLGLWYYSLVLHEVIDLSASLSSCCLHLSQLVVFTPLEPLVYLVQPLQMHRAHKALASLSLQKWLILPLAIPLKDILNRSQLASLFLLLAVFVIHIGLVIFIYLKAFIFELVVLH